MSAQYNFSEHKTDTLSTDEVQEYLYGLLRNGLKVTKDANNSIFFVELNDRFSIRVSTGGSNVQVQLHKWSEITKWANVHSVDGLRAQINDYTRATVGVDMSEWKPISVRLKQTTPATNVALISSMLESEQIEAWFDPYLDNAGLKTLSDVISLSKTVSLADNIRLISSSKVNSKRLSKTFVDLWLSEHNANGGELRVSISTNEHRRFLLLRSGKVVIIPFSLNDISKNETAHIEQDSDDIAFFEEQWSTASPLE